MSYVFYVSAGFMYIIHSRKINLLLPIGVLSYKINNNLIVRVDGIVHRSGDRKCFVFHECLTVENCLFVIQVTLVARLN